MIADLTTGPDRFNLTPGVDRALVYGYDAIFSWRRYD
jgi:hypothetical protein